MSLWRVWTNPGPPTSGITLMREDLDPLRLNHYILGSVHLTEHNIELAHILSLYTTVPGLSKKKSFYFHTGDRAIQMISSF